MIAVEKIPGWAKWGTTTGLVHLALTLLLGLLPATDAYNTSVLKIWLIAIFRPGFMILWLMYGDNLSGSSSEMVLIFFLGFIIAFAFGVLLNLLFRLVRAKSS
jgi:hypothetical protein